LCAFFYDFHLFAWFYEFLFSFYVWNLPLALLLALLLEMT
jgi:hypothetical protein